MAGIRKQTNSQDVGDVTESSLSKSPDLGVSDVQDVKPKITLDDDIDELMNSEYRPPSQCKVAWVLERVSDDHYEKLSALFDNPSVQVTKISEMMSRHGFSISYQSILRHRKRFSSGSGCRCPK